MRGGRAIPAGASHAHRVGRLTSVAIAVTASALNAIAISQRETETRRNDLTHGSAVHYGIVHVTMPKGKKAFPPELVPVD